MPGRQGRLRVASWGSRVAFTLIEVLFTGTLFIALSGLAFSVLRTGRTGADSSLAAQISLQSSTRTALVRFIKELQESIEFVRPFQGTTLNYCVARDKVNQILVIYMAPSDADSRESGRPLHDLFAYRYDYDLTSPARNQARILRRVERAAFTTLSPGLLQLDLQIHENGKSYTLLTTIRARNVLGEGDLGE